MKAVVMNQYGSAEVLVPAEVARPKPGPGQILVEIHATALNPVDYKIRLGHLEGLFPVTFPRILGGDIAGVVRELGPGAKDFAVGDDVYFSNPLDQDGGYAEFVAVNQAIVAKKPASLSYVEAASLPVVGLTGVQALKGFSGIKKGHKVLIHGGAGGVGSFAIQYAKAMGATVYTTATASKRDYVTSLGADRVIDYTTEDFLQVAEDEGGMDITFDTIGGDTLRRSILATKPGGAVPTLVEPPSPELAALAKSRGVKSDFFLLSGSRADLSEIASLVEQAKIRPTVSMVIPLSEVQAGHTALESGRTVGKLVLKIK